MNTGVIFYSETIDAQAMPQELQMTKRNLQRSIGIHLSEIVNDERARVVQLMPLISKKDQWNHKILTLPCLIVLKNIKDTKVGECVAWHDSWNASLETIRLDNAMLRKHTFVHPETQQSYVYCLRLE